MGQSGLIFKIWVVDNKQYKRAFFLFITWLIMLKVCSFILLEVLKIDNRSKKNYPRWQIRCTKIYWIQNWHSKFLACKYWHKKVILQNYYREPFSKRRGGKRRSWFGKTSSQTPRSYSILSFFALKVWQCKR
jgi:hypothetical protein